MKKTLRIAALLLVFVSSSYADPQEIFSRTFMFTRPASYNIAMDQQLWHNFVYSKEGPLYGGMQLIGFYQNSRPRDKVARYFLINGKNDLFISGDSNSDFLFSRDIRAEWVNLPTDFQGTLSVCPQQRQIGFKVMYNQDLKKFFDISFLKNWSIGAELPVVMVENDLNFSQCDMSTTMTETGREPDIFSAFNQCAWKFARIPTKKQTIMRPERLTLTLGRSLMDYDFFQLASRLSLDIPLGPRQDSEFLFSPYVGMNRHVGLGGAVYMQVLLNRNPEKIAWTFFANLDGTYYFRNKQFRTYDLKGKPWSRYMLYTRKGSTPGTTVPGVNVLTLDTVVRPYGFADFSMGWRINVAPFEFELGYDLWGFGGERVKPRSDLQTPFNRACGGLNEFGIAGIGAITDKNQLIAATASQSTISCLAADDTEFVAINENDLDLCSAAAGSILNHKVHAAAGIEHIGDNMNGFAGFGFYFEFPQKNSALATYGIWFKIGATF